MGKQETKPDKKPMRMVTSKMSIEETIEVLREDLKTNVRSKAWRKHILLNPKVEGMARFPSGVDSVLINTPVMEWMRPVLLPGTIECRFPCLSLCHDGYG